jgi:pyridoxamine 5'-phosphate oxidase
MIDALPNTVPGFDEPLAMLRACHDRIRRQLSVLERLCRHLPEFGCDADARKAALSILKYFDGAAPNHDADEEASLFPRLLNAVGADASALIERLTIEHAELKGLWRVMRPDIAAIEAGKRSVLTPDSVRRMRAAYLSHLDCEEAELFPLAAARLDAAALQAIGAEMAARREARYSTAR